MVLRRLGVAAVIDGRIPRHPAPVLSCGRGVEALALAILDGHHALSKVGARVEERGMLPLLHAGLEHVSLNDYRLGQILDALFAAVAEGSGMSNAHIGEAHTAMPHFTPDVIGSYVMRLQLSDGAASDFDNVLVTVLPPNAPPVCTRAKAQPARLWPPHHKLVPVTIEGVTDPDRHPVTLTVTQVRQDEPVNGHGDSDTSPDALIRDGAVLLRAERAGFVATDGCITSPLPPRIPLEGVAREP